MKMKQFNCGYILAHTDSETFSLSFLYNFPSFNFRQRLNGLQALSNFGCEREV